MKRLYLLFPPLISILISAELAGLAYFYIYEDRFFYTDPKEDKIAASSARSKFSVSTFFRLNPYFGYSIQTGTAITDFTSKEELKRLSEENSKPSWLSITANNYGFFSRHSYPYVPRSNQDFIIGIFGGSVAHWFALQAESRLTQLLKSLPEFQERDIRILNFAAGGYKQPQQLLILNFFLAQRQKFDLVVNIDGFNEVALTDRNREHGVHPAMPSAQHIVAFARYLSKEQLASSYVQLLATLITAREKALKAQKKSDSSQLASLAFAYRFAQFWHKANYIEAQLTLDKFKTNLDKTSLIQLELISEYKNFSEIQNTALSMWSESSKIMKVVLERNRIPYIHVLQPNQHVAKKRFSEEERQRALTDSAYNVEAIRQGYRMMKEEGKILKAQGLNFFDATSIFDDEISFTFSDNCCHLNQRGNDILALHVKDAVQSSLAQREDDVRKIKFGGEDNF